MRSRYHVILTDSAFTFPQQPAMSNIHLIFFSEMLYALNVVFFSKICNAMFQAFTVFAITSTATGKVFNRKYIIRPCLPKIARRDSSDYIHWKSRYLYIYQYILHCIVRHLSLISTIIATCDNNRAQRRVKQAMISSNKI